MPQSILDDPMEVDIVRFDSNLPYDVHYLDGRIVRQNAGVDPDTLDISFTEGPGQHIYEAAGDISDQED